MVDNTGGTIGIRDTSLLESALNAPFQTFGDEELYPSIIEKASRLCYGLIKNHPFIDGNKRIGVYAMLVYLGLNNINLDFSDEEIKEAKENPLHKAPDYVYIYRSFIPFHSHDFHDQRSISGKILCVKKDGNPSGSKGSAESDQHGFYDRGRCGKRAGRIVF